MALAKPGNIIFPLAGLAVVAVAAIWYLTTPRTPEDILQRQAEDYVVLALGLGLQKEGEVDAYFGPVELYEKAQRAQEGQAGVAEILLSARRLAEEIELNVAPDIAERRENLRNKVSHLITLSGLIESGQRLAFADEMQTLYGITLAETEIDFNATLEELEDLLQGKGSLAFKMASYQNTLLIPPDKRQAVFEAALEKCRRMTSMQWNLPAEETLAIEWTRDVQSAWHEYHGNYTSSLQINALTVALVSTAVDLACHELYPGHHAQFAMMEKDGNLNVEDTVILLRSRGSGLREGAANYAVEMVFTPEERLAFERDVLFGIAGLPAEEAEKSARIHQLVTTLSGAILPVILDYYDGVIDFNAASFRLEREAMVTSPIQLLEYVDEFGTYSMSYTVVRDLLHRHLSGNDVHARWEMLENLLLAPASESLETIQVE